MDMRGIKHSLSAQWCAGIVACLMASPVAVAAPDKGETQKREPISEEKILAAAHQIDVRVAKIYKSKGVSVPDDASDSVFLRRSFLLAVGRIPTVEEARVFLESDDPQKRILLVRYLMNSKGYSSHMASWLIDMLRVQENFENRRTAAPYMEWVRKAVAENKPFDELTRELLSAQGAM